jgi:hypothetical protein
MSRLRARPTTRPPTSSRRPRRRLLENRSDRIVPFSLSADVRVRLLRDLNDWQAGDTFDVTDFATVAGVVTFSDVLFVRAARIDVMRQLAQGPIPGDLRLGRHRQIDAASVAFVA